MYNGDILSFACEKCNKFVNIYKLFGVFLSAQLVFLNFTVGWFILEIGV